MVVGPLPNAPAYPPDADWRQNDQLLTVGDHPMTFKQEFSRQLTLDEWAQITTGTLPLHVWGRVDYQTLGQQHHSGVCARYDHGASLFRRINAPKYNEET